MRWAETLGGEQRWDFKGGYIFIETREGTMCAEVGDWIVREPFPTGDRDFYPVKDEIFRQTYEPVAEA